LTQKVGRCQKVLTVEVFLEREKAIVIEAMSEPVARYSRTSGTQKQQPETPKVAGYNTVLSGRLYLVIILRNEKKPLK